VSPQPHAEAIARSQILGITRVAVGITLVAWAATGRTDTDIWGHIRFGLDFLTSHRLPIRDAYSFTSDQRWINHEWLFDVVVATAYRFGGLTGLLMLRAAMVAVFLIVVDRATRLAPTWVRFVVLVAITMASVGQWASTRPQIATLLLYSITLSSLDSTGLPALFAVWANLHGGWIMGLGAVGLHTLVRPTRRRVWITIACGFATLLNPYGIYLWFAIWDAMRRGWSDVTEWAPIWWFSVGIAPLVLWIGLVAIVMGLARIVRADRAAWIWTSLILVAAAQSRRLLSLAAVTIVLELVGRWPKAEEVVVGGRLGLPVLLAGVAPIGLACYAAGSLLAPSRICFPPTPGLRAPESDAVTFLRETDVRGRAVIYFDYGEYAIWHVGDRLRFSIDNRRETVYSDAVVRAHQRFYRGLDPEYPMRLGADVVWVPRDSVTIGQLESRGWSRRFAGPRSVILLRQPGPMVTGGDSMGTPCFPNP
jgi:hypothetical protein